MGSGKSTIGKRLANQLNVEFIDTDDEIELMLGIEIKDIFRTKGEAWFREYEKSTLNNIIESRNKSIISLGGGTLLLDSNLEKVLSSGILIYIKSSPGEIWKRIKHSTRRPLLRRDGEEWTREKYLDRITELLKKRRKGYAAAQLAIDRDGKEVDEIVDYLLIKLNELEYS
jgi:shikimate kinase